VYRERRKGLVYSGVMHMLIVLLTLLGLPSFMKKAPPIEPAAITVELLPITGITNVKPQDAPPTEQPKPDAKAPEKTPPKEPTPPAQDAQKKPSPPVKTAAATPPPPPKDAVPDPDKKEPKKDEKKPDEKKPDEQKKPDEKNKNKAKEEDLDAVLKAVRDTAQKQKKTEAASAEKSKEESTPARALSNKYDASMPMSLSEKDAIMGQIARCWNPPAGAKNAQDLVVLIHADYNVDGTYVKAVIAPELQSRYRSDSFFRAAADAALRAVRQCSPLQNLPPDKYSTWKSMELNFDPRYMLE
jgi:hypothetical protein